MRVPARFSNFVSMVLSPHSGLVAFPLLLLLGLRGHSLNCLFFRRFLSGRVCHCALHRPPSALPPTHLPAGARPSRLCMHVSYFPPSHCLLFGFSRLGFLRWGREARAPQGLIFTPRARGASVVQNYQSLTEIVRCQIPGILYVPRSTS